MNDLTADPSSIQSYGSGVSDIGSGIAGDIDGSRDGLDATTEGLNTPGIFAGMVEAWSGVCHGVSSEVCRAGEGTTASGGDHDANESAQESGMRAHGG